MDAKSKLILALDVPTFDEARQVIDKLGDAVEIYKVGYQLFVAYGPFIVRYLQTQGKKVFLDLKFHDIPNTVANGVASAASLSVALHDALDVKGEKVGKFEPLFMLTVHAQGGFEMMKAAAEAAKKRSAELKVPRPLVVGVTVLTSDAATEDTSKLVLECARLARTAGLDGVVASAQETAMLRREMGKDFVIVTPGIRPKLLLSERSEGAATCRINSIRPADVVAGDRRESLRDDQKRVDTPAAAIKSGASFLVIGRPIVKAADPCQAARKIIAEMSFAG